MFVRMTYDRPVDEIKDALRSSARPRNLDYATKASSTVLYWLFGDLLILFFRREVWTLRFSGYLWGTKDGKTKLFGGFGLFPFEPAIALPVLLILALAAFSARSGPMDALFRVLLILLIFIVLYLLFQAAGHVLLRKNREQGMQFLLDLGKTKTGSEGAPNENY